MRPHSQPPGTSHRVCIIVLGMHRSGTSALTRVINILGAGMPQHIMGAGPGNDTGHWEPTKLVEFHDQLLAELNSSWHDWMPLDLSRMTSNRRQEIKARIAEIIGDEYGNAPLFVVKDPRICRFASLFLEALTDASVTPHCVLVFRNPAEVVQSLEQRDNMGLAEQEGRDRIGCAQAGLLWLRHVLDAEAATRGTQRSIIFYGGLLNDWRDELRGLESWITHEHGVWPDFSKSAEEQVDRFLTQTHRHHTLSNADAIGIPFMSGWIADILAALQQLRRSPMSTEALAMFDRVNRELDRASPVLKRMQDDMSAQLDTLHQCTRASINALRQELANLEQKSDVRDQEFSAQRRELEVLKHDFESLHHEHVTHNQDSLMEIEQLRREWHASRHERDLILNSTLWRLTKPIRLLMKQIPPSVRGYLRRVLNYLPR